MRRAKPQHTPIRNKIDLADLAQIRVLKKRLGASDDDLRRAIEKVGNSISAIGKEIALQRSSPVSQPIPSSPMEVANLATVVAGNG